MPPFILSLCPICHLLVPLHFPPGRASACFIITVLSLCQGPSYEWLFVLFHPVFPYAFVFLWIKILLRPPTPPAELSGRGICHGLCHSSCSIKTRMDYFVNSAGLWTCTKCFICWVILSKFFHPQWQHSLFSSQNRCHKYYFVPFPYPTFIHPSPFYPRGNSSFSFTSSYPLRIQ